MSLLRASSEALSSEVDIDDLEAGAQVENGDLLVRYAESAVLGHSVEVTHIELHLHAPLILEVLRLL